MKRMEPTKGTIHTDQRITQVDIGALEVTTMAYPASSQSIAFCHEITARAWHPGDSGWGTIIFEGSLEDLINLIKKAKTQEEDNSNVNLQDERVRVDYLEGNLIGGNNGS